MSDLATRIPLVQMVILKHFIESRKTADALLEASKEGKLDEVKRLIAAGADVNEKYEVNAVQEGLCRTSSCMMQ